MFCFVFRKRLSSYLRAVEFWCSMWKFVLSKTIALFPNATYFAASLVFESYTYFAVSRPLSLVRCVQCSLARIYSSLFRRLFLSHRQEAKKYLHFSNINGYMLGTFLCATELHQQHHIAMMAWYCAGSRRKFEWYTLFSAVFVSNRSSARCTVFVSKCDGLMYTKCVLDNKCALSAARFDGRMYGRWSALRAEKSQYQQQQRRLWW